MVHIISDEDMLAVNRMIRERDAAGFTRMMAAKREGAAAEWACVAVVAAILVAGLFGAGFAVGRASGLRDARAAAVVEAARRDGLAVLTGAVALAANGGDEIKAARFVRDAVAAAKGGAK